ncbi:7142_t:CDS:2, partial [Dentiscutata heterogama]
PEEADDSVKKEIQEGANECIKLVSIIEKFITTRKNDSIAQSKIDKYFNINVDGTEKLQSLDDLDDL